MFAGYISCPRWPSAVAFEMDAFDIGIMMRWELWGPRYGKKDSVCDDTVSYILYLDMR